MNRPKSEPRTDLALEQAADRSDRSDTLQVGGSTAQERLQADTIDRRWPVARSPVAAMAALRPTHRQENAHRWINACPTMDHRRLRGRRRSRCRRRSSGSSATALIDRVADLLAGTAAIGPSRRASRRARSVRSWERATCPRPARACGCAPGSGGKPALRALALQRPPALLGLHHLVGGARSGRSGTCSRRPSIRMSVATFWHRWRPRSSADGPRGLASWWATDRAAAASS